MKKETKQGVLICLLIIIIDLILKTLIDNNFKAPEYKKIVDGILVIANVKEMKMALSASINITILIKNIVIIIFKLFFTYRFIKLQKDGMKKLLMTSMLFIIFSWIGIYMDYIRLKIMGIRGSRLIYFDLFNTNVFLDLSAVLSLIGWVLFLISLFINFREVKSIFRIKTENDNI